MSDSPDRLRDKYSDLVSDRFYAMVASLNFNRTQKKWLCAAGRARPFRSMDDWVNHETVWKNEDPSSFKQLETDVAAMSNAFALAPWHVLWTLFVRGHRPGSELFMMFPMDVNCPRARLIVPGVDVKSVEELHVAAAARGVYVELLMSEQSPSESGITNISISVDLPLEIPSELAYQECRQALRVGRVILRDFGMPIPFRVSREGDRTKTSCALVVGGLDPFVVSALEKACGKTGLEIRSGSSEEDEEFRSGPLGEIRLEVKFAPVAKSDLLVGTVRKAIKESRMAVRSAGLSLGIRLRPSMLVKASADLKVNGQKLPRRGLGDLAEEILDKFPAKLGDRIPEGRSLTSALKSRRAKVKRRLIRKGLMPEV